MSSNVQDSYNKVAKQYVEHIYDELRHKPFDRNMLDWLIERVNILGPICDMGCGPGQIARYLRDHGAETRGIDLSPEMIAQAHTLNPDILFAQGNMLDLSDQPDDTLGGIAAFYCIIHIPRDDVERALSEFKRILKPNGLLLLTFHIGQESHHLDEWWGEQVNVDFIYYERDEMKTHLQNAGFILEEAIERDPYPEVEAQTRRAYLFARKPLQAGIDG